MRIEYHATTGDILAADSGRDDTVDPPADCAVVILPVDDVDPQTQRIDPATQELAARTPSYRVLRRKEYPPLEDLADAIYWRERGDESLMDAYLSACDSVKAKYPKP